MVKMFPPGKGKPQSAPTEPNQITADEFIARAKADGQALPAWKPINLILDIQSDALLKELTILDNCSQAAAFCAALEAAYRDMGAFTAFARTFVPPAAGSCSRPLRLPLEFFLLLDTLPRELLKHALAIKSRSRIARLLLYFTAQGRGLRRINQEGR